jgi:NAD+ synthase
LSLHRDGILVPLSGGLDSSTVLLLCAKAAGNDQVSALLMPEKQGNPEAIRYSQFVCEKFKIKAITKDISSILSKLGTYHFILSAFPTRSMQDWAARKFLTSSKSNSFYQVIFGKAGGLERKAYAKFISKHRIRAVVAYMVADENNYLVAGCAHKSEDLLGLFVKFGIDDLADIMPLKNLYRSHILQLAAYLGVPEEIIKRTPNPDIIPGVANKYMDILGLPFETLDLIIYGIEHQMENDEIAKQLDLPASKVQEIRNIIQQTEHMRNPSQTLTWE